MSLRRSAIPMLAIVAVLGTGAAPAAAHTADALVAWLDGPMVDDGTAAEIGMFAQMIEQEPGRRRALIGVSTDLRAARRRGTPGDGVNLFVHGAIATYGTMCWSVEEAIEALRT